MNDLFDAIRNADGDVVAFLRECWRGIRDDVELWMLAHELDTNRWSLYALTIGLLVWDYSKWRVWNTIRRQDDRTNVGRTLKRQKFWEGMALFGFAFLYAFAVALIEWPNLPFGVWERMGLRVVVVGLTIAAAGVGLQLDRALSGQNYGLPDGDR